MWFVFEGAIPILGAWLFFMIIGCCKYIIANPKSSFSHAWREGFDPLGWLYGAVIIAAQSISVIVRSPATSQHAALLIWTSIVGIICFFLVFTAISKRGEDKSWRPDNILNIVSLGLVLVTLACGFVVHDPQFNGIAT